MPKWRELIEEWYFAMRNTIMRDAPKVSKVIEDLESVQRQRDLQVPRGPVPERDSAPAPQAGSAKGACLVYIPGMGTGCTVVSKAVCDDKNDDLRPVGGYAKFDGAGTSCP